MTSRTSMIPRKFLLLCFAGCLSWPSLAQDQQPGLLSGSAGTGIFSNNYLKRVSKKFLNPNISVVDDDYVPFPIVWQSQVSVRIHKEIRGIGEYTYEVISSRKQQHGALIGAQYLYPVSDVFRVYGSLAFGFRFLQADRNSVHFGYSTTTAGVQFGRQLYIDLGLGGGMSGLLALKIGWLMPALKSKTIQK
ncbi:MAG: hypothetical protein GC193_09910 [Cryomorphaceae bacterium]|nr:hypothetical protein [Cryomorphaceae bacterium]